MGKTPDAGFDDVAAAFADYGTTTRGYVRYELTRKNLSPFIPKANIEVLDVGGGSGGDTAWLAEQGKRVAFIEISSEQRRYAERRFNFFLDDEVRARITMAGATLDDLPASKRYDMVLLHTVSMYQSDPPAFLLQALEYVKPGGLVSIIEKGYYGTEMRDIRDHNFTDLTKLHKTGRSINNLNQNVYAFKPEELELFIEEAGFTLLEWSGIRLLTDDFDIAANRLEPKRLAAILDAEYRHGHHPAIRGQGQLLHFIARKKS